MAGLRMILFDVSHGLCCFVRSPNGYLLLIDCGMKELFSPVEYILSNDVAAAVPFNNQILAELVVTHPHDDHISDISRLIQRMPPAIIAGWIYNWEEIKTDDNGDYHNLDTYASFRSGYTGEVREFPDWGMTMSTSYRLSPGEAKGLDATKFVNNSSIPVLIQYLGWKILIGGDLEAKGWEELLKRQEFRDAVRGTHIFVTSHHGHASGYWRGLYDAMGKPFVNLVSVTARDENVDPGYSKSDRARGMQYDGETRYMLSTRQDGSLVLEISPSGKATMYGNALADNLRPIRP